MADECDMAQAREEMDRNLAIKAARMPELPSTGECYNCGASVPPGAKFCDIDCRTDHERQIAARRREGLHK